MSDTAPQSNSITYFQSSRPAPTFLSALKAVLTKPSEFFAGMPFAVFYGNSLFFASIVIFGMIFLSVPFYSLGMLFMVPFVWGTILIGMWSLSAYMRWAVKAFAGARLSAANAFQISAYAFAPMLFVGFSWAGIAAFLWNVYLLWVGLTTYCRISGGRAVAVMIVPLVVVVIIGSVMVFALAHLKSLAGNG